MEAVTVDCSNAQAKRRTLTPAEVQALQDDAAQMKALETRRKEAEQQRADAKAVVRSLVVKGWANLASSERETLFRAIAILVV